MNTEEKLKKLKKAAENLVGAPVAWDICDEMKALRAVLTEIEDTREETIRLRLHYPETGIGIRRFMEALIPDGKLTKLTRGDKTAWLFRCNDKVFPWMLIQPGGDATRWRLRERAVSCLEW